MNLFIPGVNFEASNFKKQDENTTNVICSLKIEYTTARKSLLFYIFL